MAYKFVHTIQGPLIQGDDEILYFNQFQEMIDYHDEDPAFCENAKKFLADNLRNTANNIADSLFHAVVGGDQTNAIYGYINAIRQIGEFEYRFLPSIQPPVVQG
jgi:hypothetical protein